MNNSSPLPSHILLLLLAGAFVAYIAYVHPAVGVALLVAAGVVTLLYVLMNTGGNGPTSP
ncbi:hypothetical protein [Streptomyces sp. NPDC088915]|uniref:hypothetical protein n=1 Tax=Streptomyces sp. NPDC088915 TaxID=3365912 RepID=UPI00381D818F